MMVALDYYFCGDSVCGPPGIGRSLSTKKLTGFKENSDFKWAAFKETVVRYLKVVPQALGTKPTINHWLRGGLNIQGKQGKLPNALTTIPRNIIYIYDNYNYIL
jgi:hypothetical protein